MRLPLIVFSFAFFFLTETAAQVDPARITIARDEWGVPHIFAPTDAEVAYGMAWATAEDDFRTVQQQLLPIRGINGLVSGKSGAFFDVAVHLLGANEAVEARYETDLSADFRKIAEAYAQGLNAYAKAFPREVLHRKLFPVNGKDVIKAYVVGMALLANVDRSLSAILNEELPVEKVAEEARGSNAFAISRKRTTDGKTYLAINSHQPLEGLNSWYEAHLCSEEGWNIVGSTFAGGLSIFAGTNEHLGWAHTVNYADFADVYQLEMHPEKNLTYRFDDQWLELEPYHTKARIRILGFLRIGAQQKFWKSKYGVTIQTGQGFFSLRFPGNRRITAAEQWYRMNKATNYREFREALDMRGIICTNIVYADKDDHIFYLGNGLFPVRDPRFDWQGVLPGNTSQTLWPETYYPVDSLVQVLDPPSGYVFNANHTPFLSSGPDDNPRPEDVPATIGYKAPDDLTNRGVQLNALFQAYDEFSYQDFLDIKYDQAYHNPILHRPQLEGFFTMDPDDYPTVKPSLQLLHSWDRVADAESEAASIFILAYRFLAARYRADLELQPVALVQALEYAQQHLLTYFGKMTVPLGELQQHRRGDVSLPYGGGPDVIAAVSSTLQKDGRLRPTAGDSYIQLVRFSADGPEIESINAYGASARPESPHYTDQMEFFTRQERKRMTLDKEEVLRTAKHVYHPERKRSAIR